MSNTITMRNVASCFLAFVVMYFGIQEVRSPEQWVVFVPSFLGSGEILRYPVMLHGLVLILCGLGVVCNIGRRIAAGILALMIAQIVVTMFRVTGLDETVARDIGLFGMALALSLKN